MQEINHTPINIIETPSNKTVVMLKYDTFENCRKLR